MRLITLLTAAVALLLAPLTARAAPATSVRAIAFAASNDRGPTDPQLAPYESILRSNLRFESFHYLGESSASVSPGGKASLTLPNGGSVQLEGDPSGAVRVHRGGTVVTVSPGRPAVFMGGPAQKKSVSGVIVMVN